MKTKTYTQPLAVLSAAINQQSVCSVAALSAEISNQDGWYQLLPAGYFSAVDGRPHDVASGKWFIDAQIVATLKANTPHQLTDLVIDYEHQTLNAKENGQPAPAAGYFNLAELEWRDGDGLYVKPRFNDKAQAFIDGKEYRYLSCVFGYDKQTGTPQFIHSAALTNRPGIDGLTPLAQLCAQLFTTQHSTTQQEKPAMNQLIIDLLARLGIDLPDAANVTPATATAALTAMDSLKTNADKSAQLTTQLAALSAGGAGEVDLSQYVPIAAYQANVDALAKLTAQSGIAQVDSMIAKAQAEGKVLPGEVDYLTSMAKQQGVAALTAALDSRVAIAALSTTQTQGKAPESNDNGLAQLTAEDKTAADLLGISHADFAKSKGEK